MRAITLLAALLMLTAVPALAQEMEAGAAEKPYLRVDAPTDDDVEEAVDALKAALKDKKNTDAQLAAIRTYGAYADAKVVKQVAKGARSKDQGVKKSAIEALGWNRHKEALKQLHRIYRREKSTMFKQEDMFATTFKSIGRHGSKTSLDVLGESIFKGATPKVIEARVYGIGNIRQKRSIEMILKGMRLTGTSPDARGARTSEPRGMDYFYVSLCVLSGEDFGPVSEEWQRWWRKNKNTFKMSEERPEKVKQEIKDKWSAFWDETY